MKAFKPTFSTVPSEGIRRPSLAMDEGTCARKLVCIVGDGKSDFIAMTMSKMKGPDFCGDKKLRRVAGKSWRLGICPNNRVISAPFSSARICFGVSAGASAKQMIGQRPCVFALHIGSLRILDVLPLTATSLANPDDVLACGTSE
jgi:hypothetical protein